ncbi:MAG: hypothetical protein J6B34_03985 [Clostridia bacterium]|nr:hypothetical protein [Clostridia bacterium]
MSIITVDENNVVTVGSQSYIVPDLEIEDLFSDSKRYNHKVKIYPGGKFKEVYADRNVFKISSRSEYSLNGKNRARYELIMSEKEYQSYVRKKEKENNLRACRQIEDIILLNEDLKYFVTLTFDISKYNSTDKELVLELFTKWLHKQVRSKGLKYIFVPEYHQKEGDNKIHFHGVINNVLNIIDSGTRKVLGYHKPVRLNKINKWLRLGKIETSDVQSIVYNLPDWEFGFSTCLEVEKSQVAILNYVTKYIYKDIQGKNRVFKRRYFNSRNLKIKPDILLENVKWSYIDALPYKRFYSKVDKVVYKYKSRLADMKE